MNEATHLIDRCIEASLLKFESESELNLLTETVEKLHQHILGLYEKRDFLTVNILRDKCNWVLGRIDIKSMMEDRKRLRSVLQACRGYLYLNGYKMNGLLCDDPTINKLVIESHLLRPHSINSDNLPHEIDAIEKLIEFNDIKGTVQLINSLLELGTLTWKDKYLILGSLASCLENPTEEWVMAVDAYISKLDYEKLLAYVKSYTLEEDAHLKVCNHNKLVELLYKVKLDHHARGLIKHEPSLLYSIENHLEARKRDPELNDPQIVMRTLEKLLNSYRWNPESVAMVLEPLDPEFQFSFNANCVDANFIRVLSEIIDKPLIRRKGHIFTNRIIDEAMKAYEAGGGEYIFKDRLGGETNLVTELIKSLKSRNIHHSFYTHAKNLKKHILSVDLEL